MLTNNVAMFTIIDQQLYLYSIFDYEAQRYWTPPANEPDAASHFSPFKEDPNGIYIDDEGKKYSLDNTIYINKNTVSSSQLTQSTWFHESGHAMDFNAGELSHMSNTKELFEVMMADATGYIEIMIDNFLLGQTLAEPERDKIVQSILGSQRGYPEWNESSEEWEVNPIEISNPLTLVVRDQVLDWINALAREENITRVNADAYMVTDCLNGLLDNEAYESYGITSNGYMIFNGTSLKAYGHFSDDYWYDQNGEPTMAQCREAWAEFFAAKMTNNADALASNQLFFPETCAYLEDMAKEMLAHYKEQAGAQ